MANPGARDILETLQAEYEIKKILYRYCHANDRGDYDMMQSCFHPDAFDDHGLGTGRVSIAEFVQFTKTNALERQGRKMHFLGNVLIEVRGEIAAAESYFVAFVNQLERERRGGGFYALAGRYLDRFERRQGEWRIAFRRVVYDWSHQWEAGPTWEGRLLTFGTRDESDPGFALFGELSQLLTE